MRRGRKGKLTEALEMRYAYETKIQTRKAEKEAQESRQKENDEQIRGQDAQKLNIFRRLEIRLRFSPVSY